MGHVPDERIEATNQRWTTETVDIHPGEFGVRGNPIQGLIGKPSFSRMIGLMLCGDLPATEQASLLEARTGKRIPMNIDGITAVIDAKLGFAPELERGLFIPSRSVGMLAPAWGQFRQGGRIEGPMPPSIPYTDSGPAQRSLPS